ncbi:hypothetical protein [Pseudoalteromonas sp. R3]|uniref:hypothetical protein n=1 Tax=Pseudoalteromonas sp. R3 TaxID=1709477 RepID=UPI0006B54C4B|nr:hypothetical protein [Pseudoalteromonas sp. R3]AZZ98838.1 hypothetical protein ELR70_18075 [Pseudoalteromonas sp. R3]
MQDNLAMTTNGVTTTAKDIAEGTVKVVKAIDKFNNTISIGKDGADLNKVIKVLTDSSISKLSASFGVLGATLSFISLFSSSKSSEEIIIDMLGDLELKIDSLQSLMLERFEHLEAVIERVGANVTLSNAFTNIDSVANSVDVFLKATSHSVRKASLEKLKQYQGKDLRAAVEHISQTLSDRVVTNNVYHANLKASYGNAVIIQEVGRRLNYYLIRANLMENFIDCVGLIDDEVLLSIEVPDGGNPLDFVPQEHLEKMRGKIESNALFHSKHIQRHEQAWLRALELCKQDCSKYIDLYMTNRVFPTLDAKNHKASVQKVIDELSANWGWLDHFAVVYDDVSGSSKHAMSGLSTQHHAYSRQPVSKGKINAVIAWMDKEKPALGAQLNSKVSHKYKVKVGGGPSPFGGRPGKMVKKTYGGDAEKFSQWSDLKDVLNDLTDNPPNSQRFIWVSKKKQGVSRAQTNNQRLLWLNGKYLDFAAFE